MKALLALVAGAVITVSPAVAFACSVCFAGGEESRLVYKLTALTLTLMPFVLVGGLVLFLRKKMAQVEQVEQVEQRASLS